MILFQTQVLHPQNEAYDLCINLIIGMFLIHCNVYSIDMYSIISINIGPILAFGTEPWILPAGSSVKRPRSTACSGARGGGVLWVKRSRSTVCSGARGGGVLRAKRSRSTVCSRVGGDDVLQAKQSRSRVKRSSDVESALCRRRHALGIGGVEDLKRASGKKLLSVERVACAPDIYIGARCTTHVH
jgi:hypothetical protein